MSRCSRHTRWEVALRDLGWSYERLGHEFYATVYRALYDAAHAGCRNRREFRTVVADVLGVDKWARGVVAMANAVQLGTFRAEVAR